MAAVAVDATAAAAAAASHRAGCGRGASAGAEGPCRSRKPLLVALYTSESVRARPSNGELAEDRLLRWRKSARAQDHAVCLPCAMAVLPRAWGTRCNSGVQGRCRQKHTALMFEQTEVRTLLPLPGQRRSRLLDSRLARPERGCAAS